MPRSENSKIGAFASLLIATMFSEPCIPTLCWIAPEMPAARYSFGETGLAGLADLRRVRVPAGVDHRARRRDGAVAAERLRQVLGQLEALGLAEAATAGDQDVGALDVDVGAALFAAGEHRRLRAPAG